MAWLPKTFSFQPIFEAFLDEYAKCRTYWYVPKWRHLSKENVIVIKTILQLFFDSFLESDWSRDAQDRILKTLVKRNIVEPYKPKGTKPDRTALVRIIVVLLETLGLMRIDERNKLTITDAGLDLLSASEENTEEIIYKQVAKYQYPNPLMSVQYANRFTGILPHLFLLQVLSECDYEIDSIEFALFLNLAVDQNDLARIVRYIRHWRSLTVIEKEELLKIAIDIPIFEETPEQLQFLADEEDYDQPTRYLRISQSLSYQKYFFSFSSFLELDEEKIACTARDQVNRVIEEYIANLKITRFESIEDWISYHGDPMQLPSWFTYLSNEVANAAAPEQVSELVDANIDKLTDEEKVEIKQRQLEKDIETFYSGQLAMLEPHLKLIEIDGKSGRQFPTPIGRIDLLCKDVEDKFVVVEIKADEAKDSTFGQILRYMGWVYWNIEDGKSLVRGIILASRFPETSRYSRIGLQRKDFQEFIQFKEHGLELSDS